MTCVIAEPNPGPTMATAPDAETIRTIARACVVYQTRMTAHAVTRAYNRALAPLGLEVTQFNILSALAMGEVASVTALSDLLALDRTTMTRNLKRLEQAGLVAASKGSGRAVRPQVTPRGEAILAAALPIWQSEHAAMMAALGDARWNETRDGLRAIRRALKAREA